MKIFGYHWNLYSENPGVPIGEERGIYCPHGVKIVEHVGDIQDESEFRVVDPWPCAQVGCTPERFEQEMAAAVQDGGEPMWSGGGTWPASGK